LFAFEKWFAKFRTHQKSTKIRYSKVSLMVRIHSNGVKLQTVVCLAPGFSDRWNSVFVRSDSPSSCLSLSSSLFILSESLTHATRPVYYRRKTIHEREYFDNNKIPQRLERHYILQPVDFWSGLPDIIKIFVFCFIPPILCTIWI